MSIVAQSASVHEGYRTAANVSDLNERIEVRYDLQYVLKRVTKNKRCMICGRPLGDVILKVKDGAAFYAGVMYCGSVWLCPVCAPKIRFRRAEECSRGILRSIDLGYSNLFVTRTMPHKVFDKLTVLLGDLRDCKRFVRNQKDVKAFYDSFGFVGDITAVEMPYGSNGWHPHMHSVEVFSEDIAADDEDKLYLMYLRHARRFYGGRGYPELSAAAGVHTERVKAGGDSLGRYLSKLQEGGNVGSELTRADLKRGRAGSLMPFDLLVEFGNTGDMELLLLWHEYEAATVGRSSVRFSPGLRAVLLPDEKEKKDEELANDTVHGVEVVRFDGWLFKEIQKRRLDGRLLAAYNRGGFTALVGLLVEYNLAQSGGYNLIDSE